MRLYFLLLFLTLVVNGPSTIAAPLVESPLNPIKISPSAPFEPIYSSEKVERNWSFRIGQLGGAISENRQGEQLHIYGLRYDFLKESLSTWQFEVMKGHENFLHLVVGKKFYFPLETVTMPYYKYGVGNLIDSTVGIGSVINFKKIQGMAAVGLDDIFLLNQRLQGEIGIGFALIGPQFEISLGFAF